MATLMAGTCITATDRLVRLDSQQLYERITTPKPAIEALLRQLRTVKMLDAKRYDALKRQLPYVVCGSFNPQYRKVENFAYTDCFFIDIDNLMAHGTTPGAVKARLQADERVHMCFTSPGGDGVKALFLLKDKCYDAGLYSLFYKRFAASLAAQLGLDGAVDTRTSDAARACFVSADREAWFNPSAQPVDMGAVIDTGSSQALADLQRECRQREAEAAKAQPQQPASPSADPDAEVMGRIKAVLGAIKPRVADARPVYVPEEIERVMQGLRAAIADIGIELADERNIQYGKKLVMKSSTRTAELNLFYGRKGFSVVESPRRGTSPELNALMHRLVKSYLDGQLQPVA